MDNQPAKLKAGSTDHDQDNDNLLSIKLCELSAFITYTNH